MFKDIKEIIKIQYKKFKLFLIYKSFFKSQYYKDAKRTYEENTKLKDVKFDRSFDLIKDKYRYLFKEIDTILTKNNLTIQEEINPDIIFSIFKYTLYTKDSSEYVIHFYQKEDFSAAERMYFYILENYNEPTI